MKKISDSVREILFDDEIAFTALKLGWLNLSAYAESIHSEIEDSTWKEVKKSTIVVSLFRLEQEIKLLPMLRPHIVIDDLSLKSPLCDVTYVRDSKIINKSRELNAKIDQGENSFLTITQSLHEVTVIAPQICLEAIKDHFVVEPKAVFTNLVALTVRFSFEYLNIPNFMFAVMGILAIHRINTIEVVSTLTEFSMIIYQKDMQKATSALQKYLGHSGENI